MAETKPSEDLFPEVCIPGTSICGQLNCNLLGHFYSGLQCVYSTTNNSQSRSMFLDIEFPLLGRHPICGVSLE